MTIEPTPIDQRLARYLIDRAGGRDEALREVERRTGELASAQMQTGPDQAALLEMLAKLMGARRAVEVGTFTGYGAIRIARGIGPGGRLTCLELDPGRAETARANLEAAGVGERVEVLVGPALESLRSLPAEEAFDLAYLDADKAGYPDYYEELVPRLVPGGLLAIDNVLMGGRVLDPPPGDGGAAAVALLNDRIPGDERVESVMLGLGDGLTLVRRTTA